MPITKSVFYAKSWYLYVAAIVFTMLALFCAVLGPLFLFDIMKRADGKPGTEAGVAMSIMAVPMFLIALLGWFNVYARDSNLCCGFVKKDWRSTLSVRRVWMASP